jgi:methionine-rich copper-binding protein CopC
MHIRPAIAALLFGFTALAASEASAQCSFDQSAPNAGDVVRDEQPAMMLQFMFEIDLQKVRLLDEKLNEWPTDWVRSAHEVQKAEFRATRALPPGKYLIAWDGYVTRHSHPDGGSILFTVTSADAPGKIPASEGAGPKATIVPRSAKDSPYRAFLGARAPQPGL